MNYSGYNEFPFPNELTDNEMRLKDFFMSLDDEKQLSLLNGSHSYEIFCDRVKQFMNL